MVQEPIIYVFALHEIPFIVSSDEGNWFSQFGVVVILRREAVRNEFSESQESFLHLLRWDADDV